MPIAEILTAGINLGVDGVDVGDGGGEISDDDCGVTPMILQPVKAITVREKAINNAKIRFVIIYQPQKDTLMEKYRCSNQHCQCNESK